MIHTDKYAALKLACVKRSDRGCYQIQAVNPLGDHMASFLVTVTGMYNLCKKMAFNSIKVTTI